jgi:plastocyanin
LGSGAAAPAIAGLATGVAFIVVFSFVANNSSLATTKIVPVVMIPKGASNQNSGSTFDPQEIKVVVGYNNTVRWENRDGVPNFIEADRMDDPAFWNATASDAAHHNPGAWILPGKYFEFTFHKPGEFAYHGKPWMQGKVTVLSPIPFG